jgi:hypothetical protein
MTGNNMKNAILFGNGFNLLNGGISWNELLKKISTGTLLTGIPNTLQYETIILSQEYYKHVPFVTSDGRRFITADCKEFNVREKPIEEVIKEKIKEVLINFTSNSAYEHLNALNVEHYLTTNYDQTLYDHLRNNGYKKGESNNIEALYSIRRKFGLKNHDGKCTYIWPIHGTIMHPKSIMLGLDHYCGSVGKINEYIKGKYEYSIDGEPKAFKDLIARLKNKECDPPFSWIDLFFTHNIHIIGLGLEFDEIDLWWILNRRQRYIKRYEGDGLITNKIYYYGNVDQNKKSLLEQLGVTVISFRKKGLSQSSPTYYEIQYKYFLDKIEESCK